MKMVSQILKIHDVKKQDRYFVRHMPITNSEFIQSNQILNSFEKKVLYRFFCETISYIGISMSPLIKIDNFYIPHKGQLIQNEFMKSSFQQKIQKNVKISTLTT